jgi:hypothetical protein
MSSLLCSVFRLRLVVQRGLFHGGELLFAERTDSGRTRRKFAARDRGRSVQGAARDDRGGQEWTDRDSDSLRRLRQVL